MKTKTKKSRSNTRSAGSPTRPIIALRRGVPPEVPGREDIRLHAYQLYRKRLTEGSNGDTLSDWLRAESELHNKARLKGDAE